MSSSRLDPLRVGLHRVADHAADFLETLPERHVGCRSTPVELLRTLDRPLAQDGVSADQVIRELVEDLDGGLVASAGPRFFGFVVGGATPASLMADWLTSAWDQNAQTFSTSPAAATAELVVARWILSLLGLPDSSSVGFVTGCQMANFTALSAARNAVLERAGWDLDEYGLFGAPPITVLMSECGHATVYSALRMLGIGSAQIRAVPSDNDGRLIVSDLEDEIRRAHGQPMIVSLQAGNVNSGAFEPIDKAVELVRDQNAWVHVDGAFGLWAAASPDFETRLTGLTLADSWATDAHKWLNVPYDSGLVIIKDAAQHRRIKTVRCAYAGEESDERRNGSSWTPENSRRARAFVLYAALRELGRSGVRSIVERCCACALQFSSEVSLLPRAEILNEVVLNQVLFRFDTRPDDSADAFHRAIAAHLQSDGRCWIGTTGWKGRVVLRMSVCNWTTSAADIATTVEALAHALAAVSDGAPYILD